MASVSLLLVAEAAQTTYTTPYSSKSQSRPTRDQEKKGGRLLFVPLSSTSPREIQPSTALERLTGCASKNTISKCTQSATSNDNPK